MKTRRAFMCAFFGISGIAAIRARFSKRRLIEFSDCRKGLYIAETLAFLNGEELRECFRAEVYSDGTGRAFCYRMNSLGHHYIEGNEIATFERCGHVKLIPPSTITSEEWKTIQRQWIASEVARG